MPAAITFGRITPILRIFDIAKADEFYIDYLGFGVDWNHRFDDNAPLYRQISRGALILQGLPLHASGSRDDTLEDPRDEVIDPFGNVILFSETITDPAEP